MDKSYFVSNDEAKAIFVKSSSFMHVGLHFCFLEFLRTLKKAKWPLQLNCSKNEQSQASREEMYECKRTAG